MVDEIFVEKAKAQTKIQNKKAQILTLKHLINVNETELLLNTDFKELGLTNEKQRTAYINQELRTDKEQLDWFKFDLFVLATGLFTLGLLIEKIAIFGLNALTVIYKV